MYTLATAIRVTFHSHFMSGPDVLLLKLQGSATFTPNKFVKFVTVKH